MKRGQMQRRKRTFTYVTSECMGQGRWQRDRLVPSTSYGTKQLIKGHIRRDHHPPTVSAKLSLSGGMDSAPSRCNPMHVTWRMTLYLFFSCSFSSLLCPKEERIKTCQQQQQRRCICFSHICEMMWPVCEGGSSSGVSAGTKFYFYGI